MAISISRSQLATYFAELLRPEQFKDYGPNGLQVEGVEHISRVAFAVSATADSIGKAIEAEAQALVVHHGLFWRFHGARPLTGDFGRRVLPLARHGINLFAYHLPLDAHPEIGNAAQLARRLGLIDLSPFGDFEGSPTGVRGRLPQPIDAEVLKERLTAALAHPVLLAKPDHPGLIRSAGIITGGANRDWPLAVRAGLDAYITGEMSEHDWHESREAGLCMYAGGHSATEQFGVQALQMAVSQRLELECLFIPSENPA